MSHEQEPHRPSPERSRSLHAYLSSIEIPSLAPAEREVLVALKLFGELTIPSIGEILGISSAPLRQHVRRLEGQGLVACRAIQRIGSGRPPHVYALTTEGERLFPSRVSPIGERAVQHLADTDPAALDRLVRDLVAGTAAREAANAPAPRGRDRAVPAASAAAFLEGFTRSLGFMPEAWVRGSQVILAFNNCPFRTLADAFPAFCNIEKDALCIALPGCTAVRTSHRRAGDRVCTYLIRLSSRPSPRTTEHPDSDVDGRVSL